MKFTYNFGQTFYLEEIDFYEQCLKFKTNNGMGMFETSKRDEETTFEIYYDSLYELQNIPKLLYDYLKENNLMYWDD